MNELANTDKVLLTPCKNLPGKRAISYDDRIILDIAAGFDAAIISNDNYADLIDKKPGKLKLMPFSNSSNQIEILFFFFVFITFRMGRDYKESCRWIHMVQ